MGLKIIIVNDEEHKALCRIIDYLEYNELKHYQEELDNDKVYKTNNAENHIWHSVKTIALMLEEHKHLKNT